MEHKDCGCRIKEVPRSEETVRQLENRLNRMIGQLGGIKKMIAENRYCGDILTQVSAVESALQGFGYMILREHMETCVSDGIKNGNTEIIGEVVDLIKKLK
ncbi:MAG: metal-sensing transcriptional repressor [Ruminococcaceae bacterium]|nr:metal-sensing transcriptional repressor [Oscillospiraceae bacterium]